MSHSDFFFFFSVLKKAAMTGTLGTLTPTDPELEAPSVPEVDALGGCWLTCLMK
jgi:hypothetical protein